MMHVAVDAVPMRVVDTTGGRSVRAIRKATPGLSHEFATNIAVLQGQSVVAVEVLQLL